MNNKVKPFFIRITDDMTPQMVQDAFDKCVDAGAKSDEWETSLELSDWELFGFCGVSGMYLTDYIEDYEANHLGRPQEITLDQLDEWLGLEGEREWKSGDRCTYRGNGAVVIGWHPNYPVVIIDSDDFGLDSCSPCELSKPETPEQKAEREKKEAIDEIKGTIDFFADSYMSALSLYEQGYRKQ